METLIRYRVLLGLIWFCTVYLCPTKRTLGICGLIALYEKMPFSMSEKWRKAWCVIFFLGYFFSDNTRLFGFTCSKFTYDTFQKAKKGRWSDCADAQTGLRPCCSQTPEDRVSPVEAHIIAVFMILAIVNELHLTFFFVLFFLNSHRKFILFCWIVLHFICFTKRCLAN